jgi:hypothetical protein
MTTTSHSFINDPQCCSVSEDYTQANYTEHGLFAARLQQAAGDAAVIGWMTPW